MSAGSLFIILTLAGVWLLFRTRTTRLDSEGAFDSLVAGGQPVVVEFFTNT